MLLGQRFVKESLFASILLLCFLQLRHFVYLNSNDVNEKKTISADSGFRHHEESSSFAMNGSSTESSISDIAQPMITLKTTNNDVKANENLTTATQKEKASLLRRKELFIDRLNRLLPEDDKTSRLSIEEIARIEEELLKFDIPRNVTCQAWGNGITMPMFRWLFHDQHKGSKMCPNCFLRHDPNVKTYLNNQSALLGGENWHQNSLHDDGIADVKMVKGCPTASGGSFRDAPWQVVIGKCGESQVGTGMAYAELGRPSFDYHTGFEKVGDGLFQTTYAHMHHSPDDKFGFPELWNISDVAKLLLRPAPIRPSQPEPAMFLHNDCNMNKRGDVMREIAALEPPVLVARYKCMKNRELPNETHAFENLPCEQRTKEQIFHNTCYGSRDVGKTVLSSFHKFTFALENTHSQDYFTEKRWQVMFAGSVPLVWDNHNSLDSLPDPDAALIVSHNGTTKDIARDLVEKLKHFDANDTAFKEFFRWKKRGGLRVSFVRKLFLTSDFLVCRICEHVAHHHRRDGTVKEHSNSNIHPTRSMENRS